MAAVFDLDAERATRLREFVDLGLDAIKIAIAEVPVAAGVAELQRAQRMMAGYEADLLSRVVTAEGDARAAEKILGDGKTSRRETRRRAKRAKANASSGGALGSKMASGELSIEQADHIADAADRSDGDAARDKAFIDAISGADPDRGRQIKDEWLAARETAGGRQSEHDRQRALRRVQSYHSKKHGLGVISVEGDSVAHNNMLVAIRARADEIYRRDGGRDLPAGKHPRTRTQREFDAVYEMLCGITTRPAGSSTSGRSGTPSGVAGSTSGTDARDGGGTEPGPSAGRGKGRPDRNTPSVRNTSSGRSTPSVRIVVGLTLDKFVGRDPQALATQIGLGAIPDSVLADYAEHAEIVAALFDRHGEPLWLGRSRRNASAAQRLALILRDRGCVLCNAPPDQCDVHHTMPWTAPGKGETDIDQLALLCKPCHRKLHRDNHTLFKDPTSGSWATRPASPGETPAPRPPHPGRDHPPQHE